MFAGCKMIGRCMQMLMLFVIVLSLSSCSSTSSESRDFLTLSSSDRISSTKLHVSADNTIRSFQKSGGLYTLHARPNELRAMLSVSASAFGFVDTPLEEAVYEINLLSAFPDGGACEETFDSSISDISYSASVLTFGILPATNSHCFVVMVELSELIDGEWLVIGEFESNVGRVDVYGGANDIDNYQLTVTVRDEARALEASMTNLIKQMIVEGAFE